MGFLQVPLLPTKVQKHACVSMWPCDELATCPGFGLHYLTNNRPQASPVTLSSVTSRLRKWMDIHPTFSLWI